MNIIEIVEFISVSGLIFLGIGLVNHYGLLASKTDLPPAISEGGRSKKNKKNRKSNKK